MTTLATPKPSSRSLPAEAAPAARVVFRDIHKTFGAVRALVGIDCEVPAGEVHAIVGENGAGKSTLMKILAGVYRPDAGEVLVDGQPVRFRSPVDALRSGIGMVYQHFTLIPTLSVLDNVLLGDTRSPWILNRRRLAEKIEADAKRFGFRFDLHASVSRLGMADRQRVEIFKLLRRDVRTLILDEPTSQLAPFEAEEVLVAARRLADDGRTVLFITHHLSEVMEFATHITVLRRGRKVATADPRSTRVGELAQLMVGELPPPPARSAAPRTAAPPVIHLGFISARSGRAVRLSDIELEVRSGEMLGIAGVTGSGQDELAAVLTGNLRPTRGELAIDGKWADWRVLRAADNRIAHVPANVRTDAVAGELSLAENLFLREAVRPGRAGFFLSRSALYQKAQETLNRFHIHPADPNLPASALSGGNLQRLVLARELTSPFRVLVAENPTAGLAVNVAADVGRALRDAAAAPDASGESRAVVLISSDLTELLACDRVAVLFNGRLVGVEDTDCLDAESLGLMMGGVPAALVRLLRAPVVDEFLRVAVRDLLTAAEWWQRRLAAQIGFRLFDATDVPVLTDRLAREDHETVRAWLLLTLARLGHLTAAEMAVAAITASTAGGASKPALGMARTYQHRLGCNDPASLIEALGRELAGSLPDWDRAVSEALLRFLRGGNDR